MYLSSNGLGAEPNRAVWIHVCSVPISHVRCVSRTQLLEVPYHSKLHQYAQLQHAHMYSMHAQIHRYSRKAKVMPIDHAPCKQYDFAAKAHLSDIVIKPQQAPWTLLTTV